jgi:hypothetical protein
MADPAPRYPWLPEVLRLAPWIILAVGFALGGYFLGGRYETVRTNDYEMMVVDRLTGSAKICRWPKCYRL